MPVYKFRDVSEMPDERWYDKGSPELLRAIRRVWDFSSRTTQPRFPAGVYKHRSIEEAERLREKWAKENFEAHRKRMDSKPVFTDDPTTE